MPAWDPRVFTSHLLPLVTVPTLARARLIRKDVPAGALAYSETSQRTIEGWVLKNRAGTEPAEAAKAAGAQEPAES